MPTIVFSSIRKSDGKTLYFRDKESFEEYELIHEDDEFSEPMFCVNVPFGEQVIDCDNRRESLEHMLHYAGMSTDSLTMDQIYGKDSADHSYEDTEKRMKEYRGMSRKVYDYSDDNQLTETEDNFREIRIRKEKVAKVKLFRAFLNSLEENRKKAVRKVFADRHLKLSSIESYFSKEINMNIDPLLKEYDTEKEYALAMIDYKKTKEYQWHENFTKAMEESFDVVRKLDTNDDLEKLRPKVDTN